MLVYQFEGVPRNPLSVALKNVLTLGLYTKVWLYRVNREMDGRESFHIHLGRLAVMLWVPFVTPAIVKFQTAHRLNQMVSDPVTIPLIRARRLGWISLIPIFGAGFYAYWVQSSLNKFWFWHRRKERYQLNVEKIKQIAQEPESEENLQRRFALEQECRRIEREMEEEIEAVRLQWGEERFQERKKRADLHAERGRLSRKEAQRLRKQEKERRKEQRTRRRLERSVLARYRPRKADPDKDELWRPVTPEPLRSPQEIELKAQAESRELDRRERRELKRAERLIAAREKEIGRLEKRRARLLARKRRSEERLLARAEKKKAAVERKAGKRGEKRPKGERSPRPRRRFVVLPPRRDPEVDAHWEPRTPEPQPGPDELADAIEVEDRTPTKKESKQIARAEALLEKREKEAEKLDLKREKARVKAEGKSRREQEKQLQKEQRPVKKKKRGEKKQKPVKEKKPREKKQKPAKEKKQPREKKEKAPKKRSVSTKPARKPAKQTAASDAGSSEAGLKVLRVRCPQCGTAVPVKKQDDRPARLQCPSCGLVGKV